jgi:leucyl aminopeptidase (aminopeptidase T)
MTQAPARGSDHLRSVLAGRDRLATISKIAEIAINDCAGVRPGEKVLIVNDNAGDPEFAGLLAGFARQADGETVLVSFDYVKTIDELPERVAEMIINSEVVIPVCQSRILYHRAIKTAEERGRVLYMADFPTESLMRPVVSEADYGQLARFGQSFQEIFAAGGELRVITAAGTNASMQMVAGRRLSVSTCRAHNRGDHDYLPGGAWFGCPDEQTVSGTFVIDSSMEPGVAGGILTEPVVMEFRDGRMTSLEGGPQAEEFRGWLDAADAKIWNVAHNGGGFNAAASRTGNLMEDERILGAFNIAGGNNQSGWPGTNDSHFHWDAMMLAANYSLGGVPVCEDGRFVHPLLTAAATDSAAAPAAAS